MTDFSKMTKADLLAQVGKLQHIIEEFDAKPAASAPLQRIPEAEALAACIRALDPIEGERSNTYSASYSVGALSKGQQVVERVLRSLASKYGIALVEVRSEPCARPHVDQMSARDMVDAGLKRMDAGDYFAVTGEFQR